MKSKTSHGGSIQKARGHGQPEAVEGSGWEERKVRDHKPHSYKSKRYQQLKSQGSRAVCPVAECVCSKPRAVSHWL